MASLDELGNVLQSRGRNTTYVSGDKLGQVDIPDLEGDWEVE